MWHDAWMDFSPVELRDTLTQQYDSLKLAGVCDSGNLVLFDKINEEFPEAKWVLITRPEKEVQESCKKLNFPLADFAKSLQKLTKEKEVLKVPFHEMFDRADEIGRYLWDEWKCPPARLEQLKRTNVQIHWGKVSEQFRVPEQLKEVDALTPNKVAYYKLLKEICNDDAYALRFLAQARVASELYRQLDQGKPINIKQAKDTLEIMATEWVASPFLRQFSASLVPSLVSALEKYRNQKGLTHCPIDTELVTAVTYIFKGNDGVKEYMPKIRELSAQIMKEKV